MEEQIVNNKLLPIANLDSNVQTTFFNNLNQILNDLLFLSNLILFKANNANAKNLCLELQKSIKTLLFDCDKFLSNNIIHTEQKLIILQNINLKKLIKTAFSSQIKIVNSPKSTKLSLTITDQIPKIIIGDMAYVNKILTLLIIWLFKVRLTLDTFEVNIYCKAELFSKLNENIIISLSFKIKNLSLKKFIIYDEQSIEIKSHLIPNLIYELLKKSGGFIKYINNQVNVYLPLKTQF